MELAKFLLNEGYLNEKSPLPGKVERHGYFFMQKDSLCLVTRNTLSIFTGQDLENFLSIFGISKEKIESEELYFVKAVGVKNDKIELQKIEGSPQLLNIYDRLTKEFGITLPNKDSILEKVSPGIIISPSEEELFKYGDYKIEAAVPRRTYEWMHNLANHFYFLEDKERNLIVGTKSLKSGVTISRIIK